MLPELAEARDPDAPFKKPKMEIFEVTAYCLRGTTATGVSAGPGVAAIDPNIIPLGTRLYIEGYGWAIASDTGKLIKGKRIDIWLPTKEQCLQWGRRKVKVRR